MEKYIVLMVLLFSFSAQAGGPKKDARYERGLLKKIKCSYSGVNRAPASKPLENVVFEDPANTVCDPLSQNSGATPDSGLLGKLILRTPEMGKKISGVMDYYNKGQKLDAKLYFSDVNVPTTPFTSGFKNVNGDVLVDAQGNKLIEHFAIEYTSVLKLSAADKEGHYEIATLSDDGSRVFIKENNQWNEIINNDGDHSTRMGCAFRTVELKRDSEVPIKILYYQGPRYHIANVLIWKYHKKAQSWKNPNHHSLCGVSSNNYFFNANSGKKMLAMKFLEQTGWSVIAAANYKMPAQTTNPCPVEEPPVELALTDFQVVSAMAPTAVLSWKTNLPTNSQLRILNVYTGEEILTPLDANLVTDHTVTLDGLVHGIYYLAQAISEDKDGRKVISSQIVLLP
ncbi:MAG: hypothetical protein OM95_05370 [Bdellovibrio sp. ArHS]|uniref:PA14 domain-containing protein n=1 Tax=Bdellovibrio sp. ArHS TaxID=1569284 RepID=UPI0005824D18|nr:PA14 domain-containing protein [Bdellovibrio sp. ArHS]KHD89240.1 MAG: hypothetical protein OM95_05370 [Bdellovibrio sp. ArHS]